MRNVRNASTVLALIAFIGFASALCAQTNGGIPTLYNTGVDSNGNSLPGDSVDPHYVFITNADTSTPVSNAYVFDHIPGNYFLGVTSNSSWIGPEDSADSANDSSGGIYVYRTTFNLSGYDPTSASISGLWAEDDSGLGISLNGTSTGFTGGGFGGWSTFNLTNGFVAGLNTLDFTVNNGIGPTSLRVQMTGYAISLITNGPPVIEIQPQSTTALLGQNATFSVSVGGQQPLNFQWQWNGTNLPTGTNASLTLSNLALGSTGSYQVIVSNNLGTVTSSAVTLTVNLPFGYWTGNGDATSWSDPQNWAGQQVPGSTNNVVITNGLGTNVVISSGNVSIQNIQCNKGFAITGGSLAVTLGESLLQGAFVMASRTSLTASGSNTTLTCIGPTTIVGGSLSVSSGAAFSLPALTSYQAGCGGAYWEASGTGSVIGLPGLTNLVGPTCTPYGPFTIEALNGGQVLLTNLPNLAGDSSVISQGSNSLVDLSHVLTFSGYIGTSQLNASEGGTILVGQLTSLNGVTIPFNGTGTLNLSAITNIDNSILNVTGGAEFSLPALTSYQAGCGGAYWEASGTGSVIGLPGLTNLVGPTCTPYGPFTIEALNGGQVLLTNLPNLAGDSSVISQGSNSLVDLSHVLTFSGYIGTSQLNASEGGTILMGQLTSLNGVTIPFNGTGTLNLSAITNIDNSILNVTGGAEFSLPALTSYQAGCGGAYWEASGTGSVIGLPGLTNLVGPTCTPYGPFTIEALNGGQVLLTNLPNLAGDSSVISQGSNSLVDLSHVLTFSGYIGTSQLNASEGGTILMGQLTSLNGVTIPFNGTGTLNLSAITNIDNSILNVTGGAEFSLPALTSYQAGCGGAYWEASGTGSVIGLPGLTNLVGPTCTPYGPFTIEALNGGQVLLTNLTTIASGYVSVEANGTNSVVSLSKLATYNTSITTFSTNAGGIIYLPSNSRPILTVTATNQTMVYGGSVPALTFGYSGFVNGDTPSVLTSVPTISTTGTSSSHAGTYPITVSGGAASNYTLVYVPGTLTINPAPLTITANNGSKTYGQTASLSSTAFTASGLLNGDTIAGVTLTSTGAAPTAGVGSYAIAPSAATGPRAGNYSITYDTGMLTVGPAVLAVTANNASKYFGHTLTFAGTEFTSGGLQNGETIGAVTLTSAGAISTATVNGSPYSIIPSAATGGTFSATNYSISYVNGSLTVNAVGAPPTITEITPAAGPTNGGAIVTIQGGGFESGAAVSFGALAASNVTWITSNELSAVSPASSSGTVNLEVLNPDGNTVTATNAYASGAPPVITSQPSNQSVSQGATVQFQVSATGDPTLAYQWQYNGANLLEDGHTSGTQTPVLTVNNAGTPDAGNYQVVVTNLYESVTSTGAVLSVVVPPSITSQPQSQSVGAGGTANFTVVASGTQPLGYYWYQGSQYLTGQDTSTLTISDAQSAATYSVVVSNAAGLVTSAPVSLALLANCASVQSSQSTYPEGTNFIPLYVHTYNCSSSAVVPNCPVDVWIYTDGTTRALPVTTDASGNGTVYFTPLPVEVGLCQYAVALPGLPAPAAQGSFTILGMSLSPPEETTQLTVGQPLTNLYLLNNLTSVALTGITATVTNAPTNLDVQVSLSASAIPANGSIQTTVILTATNALPASADFSIQYGSAQEATVSLPVSVTVSPLAAQLTAIPSSLVGTMIEGNQTVVQFVITNQGVEESGPLQVVLPSAPWLGVVTAQPIASLPPGQSCQIALALTPTNGMVLGPYTGILQIEGTNNELTEPFTFTAVSSLTGNLQVTAQDELSIYGEGQPNLAGATVSVADYLSGTNVGTQVTGSNGIVTFSNLTSAYYTVSVQAPDHGSFSTTLLLPANQTTPLTAFLPLQLVDYTWTVLPTSVPDAYNFTLTTVFATQVPWPVLTITPGSIDLCQVSNNEQIDLVITNNGLIAAEGLQLAIDESNPDWLIVPLATNLGNLAAESSIVVPVIITRLATNTDVSSTIPASVNWYVAAQNTTEYNSTPIFIYDANPLNCEPSVGSSPPSFPVTNGGGGGVIVTSPTYSFSPPGAPADVTVTLQIDQTAVISQNAFHATLNLVNNSTGDVTDLQVNLNPVNAGGFSVSNAFFIQPPLISGITAVDGTGSLAVGASGQASWTLIPTTNSAPTGNTQYGIGGTLSYLLNGELVTIPLFAVPITVLPDPQLSVDYFLQHDVYSQDPFTSVVEPPVPFALGLRVRNLGLGIANDFTITSFQPIIINNANGLLINFQIIGSQEGDDLSTVPSLTLNLGDIDPGTNGVGIWWMTSSLEGDFTNFSATFQHSDALGGLETSVIQSVAIHEMNHVVRITNPSDDGIPDFLCNDTTNVDALPDDVYSSDGNVYPVTSLTGAAAVGGVTNAGGSVTVTDLADNITNGFVYFQFPDPSDGSLNLISVQRSDGVQLLGSNFWQTPYRPHMAPPQLTNLVHIFDYNSTGSYVLTYGASNAVVAPTVITLAASAVTGYGADLNASVTPNNAPATVYFQWGPTTNYGNFTASNSLDLNLSAAQSVSISVGGLTPGTTNHFQAVAFNSAGTNYGSDLTVAAVPPPMIVQVTNESAIVGQSLDITNLAQAAAYPVTYYLGSSSPAGASVSTNGVFSWQPACAEGSTTNVFTIWAVDSSSPPLSNSMTFTVVVGECVDLGLGTAVMQVGQTTNVPVTLFSTVGITNLTFTVNSFSNRFTNWTFTSTNTSVASATVQSAGPSPQFTLETQTNQILTSPSVIGTIGFTALPAPSAFVPLITTNILGTKSDGTGVGNVTGFPGQVTVIGLQPLLGASLGTGGLPILTVFGNPGSNYQVVDATNLMAPNWVPATNVLMTNLQENFILNLTAPQLYFRIQ